MYADPSGYSFTIIETQLRLAMENILRNMEQIHYTGMFCGFASAIDTALSGEGDVMTSFMQGYVTGVAGASILYGLMAFPSIMLEVKMLIGVFQSVGVGLGLYYMNEAWDDGNVPLAVYRTVMTTADIMTLYQEFGPQISDALGDSWNRFIHDNRGGIGLDGGNTSHNKAIEIADYVNTHNGTPPNGYRGGRIYNNNPTQTGAQKLPEGVIYKEYDINPYVPGQGRGAERIVIGNDGSVWYTEDHYYSFIKLE